MNYFVYVQNLVAVATEEESFRWRLGVSAPKASAEAFESCLIKIHLSVVKDSEVFQKGELHSCGGRFRYFYADRNGGNLYYHRVIAKLCHLNFALTVKDNDIYAKVGRSYLKRVRYKVMNVHPIGYVLFDLVTLLLLKNGCLPLYGASFSHSGQGAVLFAPPNAGKTLTAVRMACDYSSRILCEDITLSDGKNLLAAPWTDTYRDYGERLNSARPSAQDFAPPAPLKNVYVLEPGKDACRRADESEWKKILLLNRYGITYGSSPSVLTFCYYNDAFDLQELEREETRLLTALLQNAGVYCVTAGSPDRFADMIAPSLDGTVCR